MQSGYRRRGVIRTLATIWLSWLFGRSEATKSETVESKGPHTPDFEKFRYDFFEDPDSARDYLQTAHLLALRGDERTLAESMLLDFLPDSRAVIGLGALRSQRAAPRLYEIFEAERRKAGHAYATGATDVNLLQLIFVSTALWRIRPSETFAQALIDNLNRSPRPLERSDSASALAEMPIPEVNAALLARIDDPDQLVRYHAARGLLLIHGEKLDPSDTRSISFLVGSMEPGQRESGARSLLAAIAGKPLGLHEGDADK